MEIAGIGGSGFAHALAAFSAGAPVTYRGMTLALHRAELEVRVPVPTAVPAEPITARRALDHLTRARYRLGALLASAPTLDAAVGNRLSRLVLVDETHAGAALFELRGDRLRQLAAGSPED